MKKDAKESSKAEENVILCMNEENDNTACKLDTPSDQNKLVLKV